MNPHPSLRLTPSNSPFFKTATPKSPTKSRSEEPGLRLQKVIGTTTASATGFDCLPSARQFAYTAGAAAVVCTVEDDLKVTQRFFRARPTAGLGSREVNGHGPLSPIPADTRNRVLGGLRDHSANGSPLGASTRDWSESPGGKGAAVKERVKAATSVALSPNGKWIALGESGYKPRVLIFANKDGSSEAPICALSEHTFGVHALAFSPDSRYLASLGTVNDGFIYIWSIDDRSGVASLHSSNKCTVLVNSMIWVGRSLLTAGLRFVKCWRPDDEGSGDRRTSEPFNNVGTPKQKANDFGNSILSPKHKFLPGKNSLLGDLIDANFVAAVALSDDRAVVCTESGEICVLDDCHGTQTLTATAQAGFRITAASLDEQDRLIVAGPSSRTKTFALAELGSPMSMKVNRRQTISPIKTFSPDMLATIAMAAMADITVELDSRRGIRITKSSDDFDSDDLSHQLAAHNEAVLGVQHFSSSAFPEAAFLTFCINGSVHMWSIGGDHVSSIDVPVGTSPAMYDMINELRAIATLSNGSCLAAGDKYGTLSLMDVGSGTMITQVRAHSAEIVDIVAFDRSGSQLIATASRDRTVQLFSVSDNQLELLQTMDEHAAAVTSLLTAKDGDILLSCSTDRTIVVREAVSKVSNPAMMAFAMLRTITLKSSPTSMCLKRDTDEVLVSTVDRCVGLYGINTGQAGFNFKCSDTEGGEATALSKIIYAPSLNSNPTILGVSTSDKSVRFYSEYGSLVARDWGHTEGITDVALLSSHSTGNGDQLPRSQLVTVAADSTIFMWDTTSHSPKPSALHAEINGSDTPTTATKLSTPIGPPLRKVLSFTELSRFKRDRLLDETRPDLSPETIDTPTQQRPPSPPRVRKKTSRMSIAPTPRLEPAFRSSYAEPGRRTSLRKRSPSPPSPRNSIAAAGGKKDIARKPSLGMSLRSKSSDNVLTSAIAGNTSTGGNSGFGSVNASTEVVCRTLRAYRKKLVASDGGGGIAVEGLRELEKELRLTARVVAERVAGGKDVDGGEGERLVDDQMKENGENEVRRGSVHTPIAEERHAEQMEAVAGALGKVSLSGG